METWKVDSCQLEVDRLRGVVYVHGPEGKTLLRVCQIPAAVIQEECIDVVFDRELAQDSQWYGSSKRERR